MLLVNCGYKLATRSSEWLNCPEMMCSLSGAIILMRCTPSGDPLNYMETCLFIIIRNTDILKFFLHGITYKRIDNLVVARTNQNTASFTVKLEVMLSDLQHKTHYQFAFLYFLKLRQNNLHILSLTMLAYPFTPCCLQTIKLNKLY